MSPPAMFWLCDASLRSAICDLTRAAVSMTRDIAAPSAFTAASPVCVLRNVISISPAVSVAAVADFWARLPTSFATTEKPAPDSPAAAASTAAFSDKMLVWKAIPSISLTTLLMVLLETTMSLTTASIVRRSVFACASCSSMVVIRLSELSEASAFLLEFSLISTLDADVSSIVAACLLAEWARRLLASPISTDDAVTCSAASPNCSETIPWARIALPNCCAIQHAGITSKMTKKA